MLNEPLTAGAVVNQRYRITKVLGQGGFGITYEALELGSGQTCCLKELFVTGASTRNIDGSVSSRSLEGVPFHRFRTAFLEEARSIARLSSPHIVRVISVFESNGTAYFAMEMIKGKTLDREVRQNGPPQMLEALALMVSISNAVQVVHEARMLHKDIKPNNIMLRDNGDPVLIDFGAATDQIANEGSISFVSRNYSSPEQAAGKSVNVASDIYSLGATFYYLLTGVKPVDSKKRVSTTLTLVSDLNPAVSSQVASLVHVALAIDPEDRFQSARDLSNALIELSKIYSVVDPVHSNDLSQVIDFSSSIDKSSNRSGSKAMFRALAVGCFLLGVIFLAVKEDDIPDCAEEESWAWNGQELSISNFDGQCWIWDPLFLSDSDDAKGLLSQRTLTGLAEANENPAYAIQKLGKLELCWFNAAAIKEEQVGCPSGLRMPTFLEFEELIDEVNKGKLFNDGALPSWISENMSVWTNNLSGGDPAVMQFLQTEELGILCWHDEGPGLLVCLHGEEISGCADLMACNYDDAVTVPSYEACVFGELTAGPCDDGNDFTKADEVDYKGCECVGVPKVDPDGFGPCNGQRSLNYHNREYPLVEIADRCWFAEDLKSSKNRKGEELRERDNYVLDEFGQYAYTPSTVNSMELCPQRFHVSTESDWISFDQEIRYAHEADLTNPFRQEVDLGSFMKSSSSDVSGFAGEYNGYLELEGGSAKLIGRGETNLWWTSTRIYSQEDPVEIPYRYIELNNPTEASMDRGYIAAYDDSFYGRLRCVSSEPLLWDAAVVERYEDWGNFCYSNHVDNKVLISTQCASSEEVPVLWLELYKESDNFDQALLWKRDFSGNYEKMMETLESDGQVKSYRGEKGKAIVLSMTTDASVSCASGNRKESHWLLECVPSSN